MISARPSLMLPVACASGLLFVACSEQQIVGPSRLQSQNARPAPSVMLPSEYEGAATRLTVPPASSLSVTIVPGAEVYRVGQTAHFTITIVKDGQPLQGSSSTVTATFPAPTQPVALTAVAPGAYAFDALLTAAGQATLTVNVLHDYAGAVEAMERNIARIEAELAELRAALAGTTDANERRVLEVKIANRESTLAGLRERLATMQTPQVSNAATITVLPSDSAPPVFMGRWPQQNNSGTYTNQALVPIEVEVVDTGSGIDRVDVKIDGSAPVAMTYDAAQGRYRYQPAQPWTEGILHQVQFLARDVAGNESSHVFFFVADYTAPSVVSYSPAETTDPSPLVVITVTDDHHLNPLTWAATLSGSPIPMTYVVSGSTITWSAQLHDLEPDVYWLHVTVKDYAGNVLNTMLPVRVRF